MIFFSCKKESYYSLVQGYVFYSNSITPIANANIDVGEDHNGNTVNHIGHTTTDSNGYFKLYFSRHIYKSYRQFLYVNKGSLNYKQQITKHKTTLTVYL